MKLARIVVKSMAVALFIIIFAVFASLIYVSKSVSNYYLINVGETLEINSVVPLRASYCSDEVILNESDGNTVKMDLKL